MSSTSPPPAASSGAADGSLPPQAYANAFLPLKPRDATTLLQTRIHKARLLTDELADYFAARRELESTYLKALQKLAKRSFLSDPAALGPGFAPVYERLIAEIGETASVHGELEKKIAEECEMVMRNAPSRGEWARQKDHDDSLSSTLKELQLLESQLQKDQRKLETASSKKAGHAQAKAVDTQRSLDQTMQLWETEAPFTFEAYQRIDSQRLELLKETVTRFETLQSDAAQRLMGMTEQTLQAALGFDPKADMQEFILKNGKGTGERRAGGQGLMAPPTGTPVRRPTTTMNNSSRGGGLQRNDSVASSIRPNTAGQQQQRERNGRGAGAEFGAGPSSASLHSSTNDTQQRTTRGGGGGGGAASTLRSAFGRFGRNKSNKGAGRDGNEGDTSTVYGTLPGSERLGDDSMMSRDTRDTPSRMLDGDDDADDSRMATMRPSKTAAAAAAGGAAGGGLMAPMVPTRASVPPSTPSRTAAASPPPQLPAPQVDSEGFSIPPADRFSSGPASGAMGMASSDREELSDNVAPSSPTQRVANMSISPTATGGATTSGNTAQDQAALERVRSTLLTSGPPTRRNTTRRDRRDVRNTTYNPLATLDTSSGSRMNSAGGMSQFGALAPQATGGSTTSGTGFGAGAVSSSPVSATFSPAIGGDRAQSLVSTTSAAQQVPRPSNPFDAPPSAPGLRASITETVNAILSCNGGGITRLMVVGDISVQLKDVATTSSPPLHVRLEAFEQLEKAAPNPAFLQGVAGKPGEYMLDVASLARQVNGASSASTATILKYQVHVPTHKLAEYVPLNIDARWRLEAHQTSFLCNWSYNDSSKAGGRASEVVLTASVGPTNVTGHMAKPEGQWDAETKRMTWKLDESGMGEGGKVLARFQVDGQGTTQPVQVRWAVPGSTMSALGITIVGGNEGALSSFDEVARRTVSGKFVAQ
ncbi:hypothetical protein BDZ90DRAFT_265230 [Jaminaea rosea]|uniref:MHD domain-containing protein n=1 Tax=Jaminaea rosea TaxID=1569628 RepID=A0A316UMU3_9BASI|nr:hypothetical protein BDZ90DRAFT_265230 [Jaminaea rosea]PWN26284.1 hypothetical protein BDZ90DRAFT_265230 [Jaminaea rosea]